MLLQQFVVIFGTEKAQDEHDFAAIKLNDLHILQGPRFTNGKHIKCKAQNQHTFCCLR